MRLIDINPIILRDNLVPYLHESVPHEFAHIIVHDFFGPVQFPHGEQWQLIMEAFGVKPRITHDYDVSMVAPVYTWQCGCTVHQVSRKVHQELVEGHSYDCVRCGKDVNKYVSQMAAL